MLEYIKDHWIQYLIGATVAVLLGLGLSYYLGQKWSTPESVREQHEVDDRTNGTEDLGEIDFDDDDPQDAGDQPVQ